MRKLARFYVGLVGLAALGFGGQALAATECNTGPAPNPPLSGTVVGGVVVNAGDFCVIGGANISGGLRVIGGGVLIVCASTINGGFTADGAAEIIFGAEELGCGGDFINGGVQVSNTGPGAFGPDAPAIAIERSTINGGMRLSSNVGPIAVAANTIAGPLVCSNNAFDLEDEGFPSIITGPSRCRFAE